MHWFWIRITKSAPGTLAPEPLWIVYYSMFMYIDSTWYGAIFQFLRGLVDVQFRDQNIVG